MHYFHTSRSRSAKYISTRIMTSRESRTSYDIYNKQYLSRVRCFNVENCKTAPMQDWQLKALLGSVFSETLD